jgi:hypothetical protein
MGCEFYSQVRRHANRVCLCYIFVLHSLCNGPLYGMQKDNFRRACDRASSLLVTASMIAFEEALSLCKNSVSV